MRRLVLLLVVSAIFAAMLVFAGPASAQGGCKAFGEVVVGYGNNGKDGTEGARRLNAYGTYLHGSLLPKNPWLTDQLILSALHRVEDSFELEPLDDATERSAFSSVAGRVAGRR